MRIAVLGALLLATTLAGCVDSQVASSMFYLTPYRIEDLDCTEIAKRLAAATTRVNETRALKDKAETAPEGSVIGAMVYGPDYSRARWEQQLYQGEAARKNCAAPPPQQLPLPQPAPPSGPLQLPPPPKR